MKPKLFRRADPEAFRAIRIKRQEVVLTPESTAHDPAYIELEAMRALQAPAWEQEIILWLDFLSDELDDETGL